MSNSRTIQRLLLSKHMSDISDDDSLSVASSASQSSHTQSVAEGARDEVVEVYKASRKDTLRVEVGRRVVSTLLAITAIVVTVATLILLKNEERDNFEEAYKQASTSVRDAAVAQQVDIVNAFSNLAGQMTAYAQSTNATWPYFSLPLFETYAEDALRDSLAEGVSVANFVTHGQRETYVDFATENYESMVREGHLLKSGNLDRLDETGYHPYLTSSNGGGVFEIEEEREFYFPSFSFSPPPFTYSVINWDMLSVRDYENAITAMLTLKNETVLTPVRSYISTGIAQTAEEHENLHDELPESATDHPHSLLFRPIHEVVNDYESPVVGLVAAGFAWDASLRNLVPEGINGLIAVIRNSCMQEYTYQINGPDAIFQGAGDFHNPSYDDFEVVADLALHSHPNFTSVPGHCQYSMSIYPSSTFRAQYDSSTAAVFAGLVSFAFFILALGFCFYDRFVQRRNIKLVNSAARSYHIVSALFPSTFRDRLLESNSPKTSSKKQGHANTLKSFLTGGGGVIDNASGRLKFDSKPLADLFLETTVMFADIVGFTAWSSVREPSQVFMLLETVYSGFDEIARKRGVFKVETVGDCYVAVCGLPEPRSDHAVVMARFAKEILAEMDMLVRKLEVHLGPDTAELSLRIGVHSGPVTAGVLRAERSRFQLFGDTMNTTARIESTSEKGRIQISQETADLLIQFGKGHWIHAREHTVEAKGKGEMQTYWLDDEVAPLMNDVSGPIEPAMGTLTKEVDPEKARTLAEKQTQQAIKDALSERMTRMIDWNCELLLRLLKQIMSRRDSSSLLNYDAGGYHLDETTLTVDGDTVLDEVKEIITLPEFDSEAAKRQLAFEKVVIPDYVVEQLKDYVTCIASMYRDNPFHNFDHASHVVMSVGKLMSRIVAPDMDTIVTNDVDKNGVRRSKTKAAMTLHDHTYGITSDPLTQFACAFSALIHDVDHTGVPNAQLQKENATIAALYRNRSVAEQNSFDISWELLMDDRYTDLRATIYGTEEELRRFRQLVVNGVMATDIVDKELKALRNARWDKAFKLDPEQALDEAPAKPVHSQESPRDVTNRKATIVIEHLIQASDVAHTMQHWHVYRRWNECLFREMTLAYEAGRAEKDPAEFWYKGEIGFFDFYIIPLAKKLKDCGVFGVSSDEYLNYALKNRKEWESRGQQVVAEMIEKLAAEKRARECLTEG